MRHGIRLLSIFTLTCQTVLAFEARHTAPDDFLRGYLEGPVGLNENGILRLGAASPQNRSRHPLFRHTALWDEFPVEPEPRPEIGSTVRAWRDRYGLRPKPEGGGQEILVLRDGAWRTAGHLPDCTVEDLEWYEGNLHVLMRPSTSGPASTHLYRLEAAPDGTLAKPRLLALAPPGVIAEQLTAGRNRLFILGRPAGENERRLFELRSVESPAPGWLDCGPLPSISRALDLASAGGRLVLFSQGRKDFQLAPLPPMGTSALWQPERMEGGKWGEALENCLASLECEAPTLPGVVHEFHLPRQGTIEEIHFDSREGQPLHARWRLAHAENDTFSDWTPFTLARHVPVDLEGQVLQYQIVHPEDAPPVALTEVSLVWSGNKGVTLAKASPGSAPGRGRSTHLPEGEDLPTRGDAGPAPKSQPENVILSEAKDFERQKNSPPAVSATSLGPSGEVQENEGGMPSGPAGETQEESPSRDSSPYSSLASNSGEGNRKKKGSLANPDPFQKDASEAAGGDEVVPLSPGGAGAGVKDESHAAAPRLPSNPPSGQPGSCESPGSSASALPAESTSPGAGIARANDESGKQSDGRVEAGNTPRSADYDGTGQFLTRPVARPFEGAFARRPAPPNEVKPPSPPSAGAPQSDAPPDRTPATFFWLWLLLSSAILALALLAALRRDQQQRSAVPFQLRPSHHPTDFERIKSEETALQNRIAAASTRAAGPFQESCFGRLSQYFRRDFTGKVHWGEAIPLPKPLHQAALFHHRGRILAVDSHGTICTARLRADGSLGPWGVRIGRLPRGAARGHFTVTDTHLVCLVGREFFTAVIQADSVAEWTRAGEAHSSGENAVLLGVGDRVYAASSQHGEPLSRVCSYRVLPDGEMSFQSSHPPIPGGLVAGTLVHGMGRLYWAGGHSRSGTSKAVLSAGMDPEGHLSEWRQEASLPTACRRPILEFWDQKLWLIAAKVHSADIGRAGQVRRWAEWQSDLKEHTEEGSVVSAGGKFLLLSGDTAASCLSPVHLHRPV